MSVFAEVDFGQGIEDEGGAGARRRDCGGDLNSRRIGLGDLRFSEEFVAGSVGAGS